MVFKVGVMFLITLLSGCTTTSGIAYVPNYPKIKCSDFDIDINNVDISGVTAVHFGLPVWFTAHNSSSSYLVISAYITTKDEAVNILNEDVLVHDLKSGKKYAPFDIKYNTVFKGRQHNKIRAEVSYDVALTSLDSFELVFKEKDSGCNIESISFNKSDVITHSGNK